MRFVAGGVDQMDRDITDWGITVRTCRWFMRIAFYVFDLAFSNMYKIAMYYAGATKGPEWYSKYRGTHGRYKYQMDVAQTMIKVSDVQIIRVYTLNEVR
jgi:hypothetical protein